jgi:hypothetical protein
VKSDEQRGAFGAWLRRERTARFENVPKAVAALKREAGYGIAPSVWAELESGSRRPSDEQRERLTGYFGSEPATLVGGGDALVAAIRELTDEVRASRLAQDRNADVLAQLLAVVVEGASSRTGNAGGARDRQGTAR